MATRMPSGRLASVAQGAARSDSLIAVSSSGESVSTTGSASSGALQARLRRGAGLMPMLFQMQDRFPDRRVEPVAAGVQIGEDRFAHARVPELLDMIGDPRHDLVRALRLEELADLVRHIDEAVGFHGARMLPCRSESPSTQPRPEAPRSGRASAL